ncbi:hypothetical protein WICMUC_004611 [Wickerhamomyces mucosus]|uniref:PRP1 splicing factor N-terminal domain-containing protein n=1 Tax=Wickerhamomyces mucosus TaxID=1378264 RepID=A0A9P8TA18_9ASCO|nr:hypothetical protein WICMUC_004611 [Wickerhamomyces mucosus]
MERKSFLDQEAPPGYVAGIGRGATGFTTRADVGGSRTKGQERQINSDDEDNFADVDNENDNGLFTNGQISKDDTEADAIYKEVEERLKSRSNKRKISVDDLQNDEVANVLRISNQFIDLKKNLSSISAEQWSNLPEVGDLTKRNKRQRKEEQDSRRTYAAPDSLISGLDGTGATETSIDLASLTSERQKLFESKIDANLESLNGEEETVNSQSYLSEISANSLQNNNEEIQKLRTVLNQFTKSDPNKPEGWIARARLEETSRNFETAKKLISQGCNNCPNDEGVWLENVRLNQYDIKLSKIIIADGVRRNEKSVKLWLKAAELEKDLYDRRRIIRKALDSIPKSAELWSELIDLADDFEEKTQIASRATELVPSNIELWLKLIDLQNYQDARSSLNKARKANPNNVKIWLRACQLESENANNSDSVSKLIMKTFKECEQSREEWFKHAIEFENKNLPHIADQIVSVVLNQDESMTYNELSEESTIYKDNIHVYRACLNFIVKKFPKKTAIWRNLIDLYKKHFTKEELYQLFEKLIGNFPKNATFRLMYSKEVWKTGNDVNTAKKILESSLKILPNSTDIWLALIKLEQVSNKKEEIESLFSEAQSKVESERIWYKYATHLRQIGNNHKALEIIDEGLLIFNKCFKLYLQKSQILEEMNLLNEAKEILSIGTKNIPSSPQLWINLSKLDMKLGNKIKARSDLELGILKNPTSEELVYEKLLLEKSLSDHNQLAVALSRALKDFPHSSLVWSFNLRFNSKKSARKTLYKDALAATNNDSKVLLIIGHDFWVDGKIDKAQRWFERAVEMNENYGDAWAWNYKILKKTNNTQQMEKLIEKYLEVEPTHGDYWQRISKQIENLDKDPLELLDLIAQNINSNF